MARSARLIVEGGYYHILTRGNDRRKLFLCRQDYEYLVMIIKVYLAKFKVGICHYCLMTNHLHLLMQAGKAEDLPKFMQVVLQVYAGHFRRKYKSTGFVFQNRYKSRLIENDSYLLECARYIERNPLRARLVDNLLDYPWSSFSFYCLGKEDAIINLVNPSYMDLANSEEERRRIYRQRALENRPYEDIVDKAFRIT